MPSSNKVPAKARNHEQNLQYLVIMELLRLGVGFPCAHWEKEKNIQAHIFIHVLIS